MKVIYLSKQTHIDGLNLLMLKMFNFVCLINKMLKKYLQDVGENWNSLELKNHELYIISNHDSLFELPVISNKRTFIISLKMFSYDMFSMKLYLFIPRYTLNLY